MKTELRQQLRAARRSISKPEHARRSRLAALGVLRLPGFRNGKRVAVYLPFDQETDTALLVREARRRGISLFVPVVIDKRRCRMQFHRLVGPLQRGHFGIRIPQRTVAPIAARWLNLIVLPLVGIDPSGHRLGMGAGFYDRVLAFRRARTLYLGPHLAGLAFDVQRTPKIFAQPWDQRLDTLATESGLHYLPIQEGAT